MHQTVVASPALAVFAAQHHAWLQLDPNTDLSFDFSSNVLTKPVQVISLLGLPNLAEEEKCQIAHRFAEQVRGTETYLEYWQGRLQRDGALPGFLPAGLKAEDFLSETNRPLVAQLDRLCISLRSTVRIDEQGLVWIDRDRYHDTLLEADGLVRPTFKEKMKSNLDVILEAAIRSGALHCEPRRDFDDLRCPPATLS